MSLSQISPGLGIWLSKWIWKAFFAMRWTEWKVIVNATDSKEDIQEIWCCLQKPILMEQFFKQ